MKSPFVAYSSVLAALLLSLIHPISAQAQHLTGGNPASPALNGCMYLGISPGLTNVPCGSLPAGQFAGSVWMASISADGKVLVGSHWIQTVSLGTGVEFTLTFKAPFVATPICVATPSVQVGNLVNPPVAPFATVYDQSINSVSVSAGTFRASTPSVRSSFNLYCSIGQ